MENLLYIFLSPIKVIKVILPGLLFLIFSHLPYTKIFEVISFEQSNNHNLDIILFLFISSFILMPIIGIAQNIYTRKQLAISPNSATLFYILFTLLIFPYTYLSYLMMVEFINGISTKNIDPSIFIYFTSSIAGIVNQLINRKDALDVWKNIVGFTLINHGSFLIVTMVYLLLIQIV